MDEMKSPEFIDLLNDGETENPAWKADFVGEDSINGGYPILSWQQPQPPEPQYTAVVASGIENGTVSVSPDTTVDPGTVMTVTVTPDPGYILAGGSLAYAGAPGGKAPKVTPITVANGTENSAEDTAWSFVMPAYDVTLTATFEQPEVAAWDGATIDVSWYDPEADEYHIQTPEQLMGLAAIVNGIYNKDIDTIITGWNDAVPVTASGTQGSPYIIAHEQTGESGTNNQATGTWHYGDDDMNAKTIYLEADIDMGGAGNYMPIGGQYLMEKNDYTTKISASFNGVFDGQGHWVRNIFANRRCTTGNFGDGESVGLIGRLGCHDSDDVSLRPSGAAVKNVAVTGLIRSNRSVGGIVGKIGKTLDGGTIENCANYALVYGTDAKGTGGIAGAGWNAGIVKDCFNAGVVSGGWPAGGIVGSNEIPIQNSYNIGLVSSNLGGSYAQAIGTDNGGAQSAWSYIQNVWYLEKTAQNGGYYTSNSSNNTRVMTSDAMKSAAFVTTLNAGGSAWATDFTGADAVNGGYPILAWMKPGSGDGSADIEDPGDDTPTYTVTGEGEGGDIVQSYTGAEQSASWTIDGPAVRFVKLWLKGAEVPAGSYTVEISGDKTLITLNKTYLSAFANGTFGIVAEYLGSTMVSLPLTVKIQGNPLGEDGAKDIISKTALKYDRDSGSDLNVRVARDASLYDASKGVTVDGAKLAAWYFTLTAEYGKDGKAATLLTVRAACLASLSLGTHEVKIPYYGGTSATQKIEVSEKASVEQKSGEKPIAQGATTPQKPTVEQKSSEKPIVQGAIKALKKPTVKKITAGKKRITVKFAKAKSDKITGYQLQWRIKGKSKWSKVKTVSAKKTKVIIKKLKKGKRYEVRIRTYRKVTSGKAKGTYRSAWSKPKTGGKVR
jgi:hypothetical protein